MKIVFIPLQILIIILLSFHYSFTQNLTIEELHDDIFANTEDLGVISEFLESKGFFYQETQKQENEEIIIFKHSKLIDEIVIINLDMSGNKFNYGIVYTTRKENFLRIIESIKQYDFIQKYKSYIDEDNLLVRSYAITEGTRAIYEFKNKNDVYNIWIKVMGYIDFKEFNKLKELEK